MTNTNIPWLSEPQAHDLFMHFPLPLAVIELNGNIKLLNHCFNNTFTPDCLESTNFKQILQNTLDKQQFTSSILSANNQEAIYYARSLNLGKDTVLIFEKSAETFHTAELTELHQRVIELEKLNAIDRLTGAWNRIHFDKIIKIEVNRSIRYRQSLALIFIDIDHFQQVNNQHGPAIGDQVLFNLAYTLTNNIRSSDTLFRWGGDEFVILAPGTTYSSAGDLAEKLRTKIAQQEINKVGNITLSVGVAEHIAKESDQSFFRRADTALYAAKNGGRNRVIVDAYGNSDEWQAE